MLQNQKNQILQTALKYYNQLRSVRNEVLTWLQIAINTENKIKVETTVNKICQQILDFITIDALKIEQQHYSFHHIITLPMTRIVNMYFNKYPMAWELMHCRLLNPSDSVMKSMYRQQTVTVLLKHCPKKLNQAPCTICYTAKIKHSPKYQGLIQLFLTKIIINMEFSLCKRDFCPYIHFHANWFL